MVRQRRNNSVAMVHVCVWGGGGGEGVADPSAITYYCRSGNIHEAFSD